jgi:hypothetical protein
MPSLRQLLRRRSVAQPPDDEGLDKPLLSFSDHDSWTVRDACEGTQIFGACGSGKTSGSGRTIASAFLESGFGGLVLTAKPDETTLWQQYCTAAGREDDLIVFSPSQPWRFNFLDYELNREGAGAGITENIVSLFTTVLELDETDTKSREPYWQNAMKQLLRRAIDLLSISTGRINLPDLHRIVMTAPYSLQQLHSEAWKKASFCHQLVAQGERLQKTPAQLRDFAFSAQYWFKDFPTLAETTRSCVVNMFTSLADGFLTGQLCDLFCTDPTLDPDHQLTPEITQEGKIILLDLPQKQYHQLGTTAQALWKYVWQRSIEQRNTEEHPLPVFLWVDEAQLFLTSYDQEFQTTARSSRTCTVYLTQSLSNYHAKLGAEGSARAKADSLLGNLQTKIFHANGDSVTNNWASELFAKSWQYHYNTSSQQPDSSTETNNDTARLSHGTTQSLDFEVLPQEFTSLRKGGPPNDNQVDAIIFQGGRVWNATGKNYLRTFFQQES